ncbi:unnamed protein product, partial [Arabidopsis halleri]
IGFVEAVVAASNGFVVSVKMFVIPVLVDLRCGSNNKAPFYLKICWSTSFA